MDASIRSRSAILTIAIHAAILLLLMFVMMKISIPPFPESGGGGGVIVNIGTLEEVAGDVQPMSEVITKEPVTEKVKPSNAEEEKVATQEFEESPIAKENKPEKKHIAPVKTQTATVVKPKPEPVKQADPNALYKGKTTASNSQGTGTGKGDQGNPQGDPFSKYTGKNGNGTGGTGNGTGDGNGEGSGSGSGKGNGISFSLSGRHMVLTPQINDRSQETGKVVVDITVDKEGIVVAAIPGGRGSTTTSQLLFKLAKDAALKAKFSASNEAADIQKGTITFVFLVQ
jgi:outer membrane biosynthesis protein TonB